MRQVILVFVFSSDRTAAACRIQAAYYHVVSRGNKRKAIFRGDPDRENFMELIRRASGSINSIFARPVC